MLNEYDLSVINVDGTHKVSLSTAAPFSGNPNGETRFGSPVWSPTGNKIAFASRTVAKAAASVSPEPASATAEGLTGIYLINVKWHGPMQADQYHRGPVRSGLVARR